MSERTQMVTQTGDVVKIGDTLRSFRDEDHTVKGFLPPERVGQSGKVETDRGIFYAGVFACTFIKPKGDIK